MHPYYLVLIVVLFLIIALYSNWARPSILFLIAVLAFMLFQVLTPEEVLKGLANKQIAVIFLLVILSSGFRKAFGNAFFNYVFRPQMRPKQFLMRMMLFCSSASAFINNTPIVAFMIPYVKEWVDSKNLPVSKFMIPLSFATVLGGMITVVGTSTNLLLSGLIIESGGVPLSYKDFLFLGVIVTVLGLVYLYTIGYMLLPNKKSATIEMEEHTNEYIVETIVEQASTLAGKSITDANLRNLKDVYLFEIGRNGSVISPVSPDEKIEAGDQLYFSGRTAAIARLVKEVGGLTLPDATALKNYNHHNCIEAIIPANSILVGKKVRESDFRKLFNASIIALHRQGKRISGSVGETELNAGDLLLLLGGNKIQQNNSDLFLLKQHDIKLVTEKSSLLSKLVTFGAVCLLILGITGVMDLFMSALVGILLFISVQTLNFKDIRAAFDFDLAVLLIASLAIGFALHKSGAADIIAGSVLKLTGIEPIVSIILLFVVTVFITAVLSNAAAMSIVFPLAVALAEKLQVPTTPFFVAIAFAASGDFITPIGYQCNLMVYGPGNYSFKDFFKVGFPLTILYTLACITFIYWYYNL
ncbi:MAG: SLC13 family permease [Chitinophagaceae bacterium]